MGSKSRIGGIFWRAISKFTASSDGMSLSQTQLSQIVRYLRTSLQLVHHAPSRLDDEILTILIAKCTDTYIWLYPVPFQWIYMLNKVKKSFRHLLGKQIISTLPQSMLGNLHSSLQKRRNFLRISGNRGESEASAWRARSVSCVRGEDR